MTDDRAPAVLRACWAQLKTINLEAWNLDEDQVDMLIEARYILDGIVDELAERAEGEY